MRGGLSEMVTRSGGEGGAAAIFLECNVSQGGHTHSPDSLDNRPITCNLNFLLTHNYHLVQV